MFGFIRENNKFYQVKWTELIKNEWDLFGTYNG